MFRSDVTTPWGPAIDFRRTEVRRFFTENALYWLIEYRFDGLRFDAVHAITEPDWLDEMAAEVRATVERGRHVHLVLENDDNDGRHLARDFDAQWNDDGHHVLHVLLTGEREGYYEDYADEPAERLARCLQGRFHLSGRAVAASRRQAARHASADLPPTAFVLFLQNHDQIGNRAFGERLTRSPNPRRSKPRSRCSCSAPQIPLMFMGEETASESAVPVLHRSQCRNSQRPCARAARREFASFSQFSDPALIARIPDPNARRYVRALKADRGCRHARQRERALPRAAERCAAPRSSRACRARMRSMRTPSGPRP